MSERTTELKKHLEELCIRYRHYDDCLEFEDKIGVKCDVSPIVTKIETEISYINTLLGV